MQQRPRTLSLTGCYSEVRMPPLALPKHATVPSSMGKNVGFKGPGRVSISTLEGRVVVGGAVRLRQGPERPGAQVRRQVVSARDRRGPRQGQAPDDGPARLDPSGPGRQRHLPRPGGRCGLGLASRHQHGQAARLREGRSHRVRVPMAARCGNWSPPLSARVGAARGAVFRRGVEGDARLTLFVTSRRRRSGVTTAARPGRDRGPSPALGRGNDRPGPRGRRGGDPGRSWRPSRGGSSASGP